MSHLAKSPKNTGHGGARPGAGRPSTGKKAVTLRLTPQQHQKLLFLGGSNWIVKRLDELDERPVFVFRESPMTGWSMKIVPGFQLNLLLETETSNAVVITKTTAFSEKAEAKAFIEANREQFETIADNWLVQIDRAKV